MVDTPAVAALRSRISDILMSDSCQRIDFRWGPYHIDGWNYTAVALSLVGASRSLRVAVGGLAANQGAPTTRTPIRCACPAPTTRRPIFRRVRMRTWPSSAWRSCMSAPTRSPTRCGGIRRFSPAPTR